MPACRLIQDFIVPSLDNGVFSSHLYWEDEQDGIFRIRWTHKAKSSWTDEESAVFTAWDIAKHRPVPVTHQDFVDSKQRLRAALRNLRTVQEMPGIDGYRRYKILDLDQSRSTQSKATQPAATSTGSQGPKPRSKKTPKIRDISQTQGACAQPTPQRATARKCLEQLKTIFKHEEAENPYGTRSPPKKSKELEEKWVNRVPPMRIIKTENSHKVCDLYQPSTSTATEAGPSFSTKRRQRKTKKEKMKLESPIVEPIAEKSETEKKVPKRKTRVSQECWASSLEYPEYLPRRSGRSTKKNTAKMSVQSSAASEECPLLKGEIKEEHIDESCVGVEDATVEESCDEVVKDPESVVTQQLQEPQHEEEPVSEPESNMFGYLNEDAQYFDLMDDFELFSQDLLSPGTDLSDYSYDPVNRMFHHSFTGV